MIYNYLLYKPESSKRKTKDWLEARRVDLFKIGIILRLLFLANFSCVRYVSIFQNVNVKGWHYTAEINDLGLDKT
jgi:hypothetical protein